VRILALIPARGGSKRLAGKNLRLLGGRPLIDRRIEDAQGVSGISDVVVSTDDEEIADVARKAGAVVPWLRPAALATDTASLVDVALHALEWYEADDGAVDGLLLLQPTSPFRRKETVGQGIASFSADGKPTVAVAPAKSHPMWSYKITDGALHPFVERGSGDAQSQQLPAAFQLTGGFYLISPADLRRYRSFVPPGTRPLMIDSELESLDIDTELDWMLAEAASRSAEIG
jgi:CMP-N,N'-diacetyllegionaminic acid synthase